jgi:hypothetical protein
MHHNTTFAAHDIRLFAANNSLEKAATLRIADGFVWDRGGHYALKSRALAHRAIVIRAEGQCFA